MFLLSVLLVCSKGHSTKSLKTKLQEIRVSDEFDCDSCSLFLDVLSFLVKSNSSEEDVEKFMIPVCYKLLKIEDETVCKGILKGLVFFCKSFFFHF